jgi:hypothetical protein
MERTGRSLNSPLKMWRTRLAWVVFPQNRTRAAYATGVFQQVATRTKPVPARDSTDFALMSKCLRSASHQSRVAMRRDKGLMSIPS